MRSTIIPAITGIGISKVLLGEVFIFRRLKSCNKIATNSTVANTSCFLYTLLGTGFLFFFLLLIFQLPLKIIMLLQQFLHLVYLNRFTFCNLNFFSKVPVIAASFLASLIIGKVGS